MDILKRESGEPRREGSQFYRRSISSWIPDPSHIASLLPQRDTIDILYDPGTEGIYSYWRSVVMEAGSIPLDAADRCTYFQLVEHTYLDKVHMIPIREVGPARWVVQPWLRGFESTFNLDFNTLTTAYVARH